MFKWQMFLQNLFPFAKGIRGITSRKMHRTAALLTAGTLVFSLFDFFPEGFRGINRDAMAASRQVSFYQEEKLEPERTIVSLLPKTVLKQEMSRREEPDSKEEVVREEEPDRQETVRKEEPSSKKEAAMKEEQTEFVSSNHGDYQVLLNIVQAEAGSCDAMGKILVANVILNRVKSKEFPNTITGVVYEKSQFTPAMNGSINRVSVSESTKDCVARALNGEDYSQGALYFMNRGASQSGNASWFDQKLTYLFQHEKHEFFK